MILPRLYLFDDQTARRWAPFADTRPIGELLLGTMTLRARAENATRLVCSGHLSGPHLDGFDEPGAEPAVRRADVPLDALRVFLLSRVALAPVVGNLDVSATTRLTMGGRTVGWAVPPGDDAPSDGQLADPDGATGHGPHLALEGDLFEGPWDLVARNPAWITRDAGPWARTTPPDGVLVRGDGGLVLQGDADIESGVIVDTRGGPVCLAPGVRVEGPARLTGPLWVGGGSTVLGGSVGTSSIGPVCKVRGEVADSIFLGYANKAHDGHLGHAVVGRWVNLGAGTTNSDLKNTYGTVSVWTPDGAVDTGLMKVGCFLGDHVKTAIGTLINTGTVVGAGANLFGAGMPPKAVRAFSWGGDQDSMPVRLEDFFAVATRAMGRRGQSMTPGVRHILECVWNATHGG